MIGKLNNHQTLLLHVYLESNEKYKFWKEKSKKINPFTLTSFLDQNYLNRYFHHLTVALVCSPPNDGVGPASLSWSNGNKRMGGAKGRECGFWVGVDPGLLWVFEVVQLIWRITPLEVGSIAIKSIETTPQRTIGRFSWTMRKLENKRFNSTNKKRRINE